MQEIFSNNFYNSILIEPAETHNNLSIVSGYASPAMVFHHLKELATSNLDINLNLIIGMTSKDGISMAQHTAFKKLMDVDFRGKFECRYIIDSAPVHSKVYSWNDGSSGEQGFMGSLNYSQNAFLRSKQRELAIECAPEGPFNYYNSIVCNSVLCNDIRAEELTRLYVPRPSTRSNASVSSSGSHVTTFASQTQLLGLKKLSLSLINRNGAVSARSSLNWGQRPNREPNQAYIPLPSDVYHGNFFPPVAEHFTVVTDDGQSFTMTRAQQNGKAIETPHDNSLIGKYFRQRLLLPLGSFVEKRHLENYGRTTIDFYKEDDETYYLDFSV